MTELLPSETEQRPGFEHPDDERIGSFIDKQMSESAWFKEQAVRARMAKDIAESDAATWKQRVAGLTAAAFVAGILVALFAQMVGL